MHRSSLRRDRLAVGLLLVAGLVAACGGNASPSASASAAPASPAASSAASAPAASGGQVLDVSIRPPYTLTDLPASIADTVQAGIEKNLGPYGKAVHVTMKSIQQNGTSAAYLMVVAFPRGTLNDTIYQQVLTDLAMGAESDFTPKLIGAVPVAFGSMSGGSVAVFRQGDIAFIVLSPKTTDLTPIAKALVDANG